MTPAGVVVLGATGQVGRLLTRHLLGAGCTVLAHGRSAERLDHLRAQVGADAARLSTVACRLESESDVATLREAVVAQPERASAAVAALGGWYVGAEIADLPVATWASTIAGNLTSHFVAARGVAPALDAAAVPTYLLLNGIASLQPCVGSGAICVAGVGQTMLVDMLRAEQIGARVRFRQLTILGDVLLTGGAPAPGQVGIETVAEGVTDMLTSAGGPTDVTIEADDSEAAAPIPPSRPRPD